MSNKKNFSWKWVLECVQISIQNVMCRNRKLTWYTILLLTLNILYILDQTCTHFSPHTTHVQMTFSLGTNNYLYLNWKSFAHNHFKIITIVRKWYILYAIYISYMFENWLTILLSPLYSAYGPLINC